MNRQAHTLHNRAQRKHRVRATITGTVSRPRLSIFVSNRHIIAQIIDDTAHSTLAYATTVGKKDSKGPLTEKATWVGTEIAKQAKAANVKQVVFDRGNKIYHGRVAALADAARKSGLEF